MTWNDIIENPVAVIGFLNAAIVALAAVLANAGAVPLWVLIVGAVFGVAADSIAVVRLVTPVSNPKDNDGNRLTPEGE